MRVAAALATLACAFASRPAHAFHLRDSTPGLTRDERAASATVLADAAGRLPPRWAAALGDLRVEWRDDLPAHVDGRYAGGVLRLRRALLRDAPVDRNTTRGSNAALAAVLHELAHAWDRSTGSSLSRDPRLLDLAGWSASPWRAGRRLAINDFRDRTPDAYELERPSEFVAVNLEHFLLDADYACRRPALARYFAARSGATPPDTACAPPPFLQPVTDGAAEPSTILEIDPARVYAVDYLLAEPDAHPMSRWGHSMLRLVICAPQHAPGPACRLDLAWHVVLSFRAFVDDVQISSWRGLTGDYPSRLFVLPLPQVVDDYTKVELRGLRSVPLRLSRDEVASLLSRAAQVHWSYDGRYRFITRNCAIETWRLLHDGVPRIADADVGSITPTGLLSRLERAGIADASVLDDADAARRLGYRFDAMSAHFQALLDVARASLPIPQKRVVDWLDLDPSRRARWIEATDLRAASAMLVLEDAALRRVELRAGDAVKRRLAHASKTDTTRREVDAALQDARLLAQPALLAPSGGYGIPQADERVAARSRAMAVQAAWKQREDALRTGTESTLPPETRAALAATRRNVGALAARVRALARSATPAAS